jgi:hypothetical protein
MRPTQQQIKYEMCNAEIDFTLKLRVQFQPELKTNY